MRKTAVVALIIIAATCSSALGMVGGGNVVMKAGKAGDVVFSHELHVDAAGIACTECHDKLYVNSRKHKKVTMKEMQKGKSCGLCHNAKKAFSVKADCNKCHKK